MTGMFMTKEDQEEFDKYTKEQIYEAYLSEVDARKKLNDEVIKLNRLLAEIRFAADKRNVK